MQIYIRRERIRCWVWCLYADMFNTREEGRWRARRAPYYVQWITTGEVILVILCYLFSFRMKCLFRVGNARNNNIAVTRYRRNTHIICVAYVWPDIGRERAETVYLHAFSLTHSRVCP